MRGYFMRILVTAIALANIAAAGTIELDLRDEHGAAVVDVQCGITAVGTGAVRVVFSGPRYDGPVVPRAGDRLYAYRRGFDLFTRALAAGERRVTGTMVRTTDRCRVVLATDPAARAGSAASVDPVVHVLSTPRDRGRKRGPVEGRSLLRLAERAVVVPLPRGMETSFFVQAEGRIVWPVTLWPRSNQTCTIHIEPERAIDVRYPHDIAEGAVRALCVPDFQWQPSVAGRRVDAWRWHLNGPGWLEAQVRAQAGVVRVSPDVPFHFFGQVQGVPCYRKITQGASLIDLAQPRLRRVARRPTIGRTPVRSGTVLAPGRLDRHALARLIDEPEYERHYFIVGPASVRWPAPQLPEARWLTLWERGHGIAHVVWSDDGQLDGSRAPGTIRLELPAGVRARGHAAVFPVWKGAGTVRTVPPDASLRRRFEGQRLVFRGLPRGHYAVSLDVRLTDSAGRGLPTRNYVECSTGETIKLPLATR